MARFGLGSGVGLAAITAVFEPVIVNPTTGFLPAITNILKEAYSPFKVVQGYSGPTLSVCATAAADTPTSTIDVYPDPATGNPDFGPAIAAYGSAFDIYKLYSQTGSGNDAVTPVAIKRFAVGGANAWGALQPISGRSSGSYALIPDTLVTSRQNVSLVSVTAQRGMYNSSQIMGLANTNNIATYLNMLSDYAGVQALGNAYMNGSFLGLITPTIKAICSGAANVKIHRNDDVTTRAALTASASMLGGAIGAIKSGAGASVTGQSAFEDHFFHAVYTGMVSDADMVTLKAFLKTRFEIVTAGKTWQLICFGDSIMWGQAASGGRGYPSKLVPYLPANVEISNPSTPGRTLGNMISDWNGFLTYKVEAAKAKKFVLCNGGTNDIGIGSTAATTLGRVQTLATAIISKGAIPIFYTIPARGDTQWSPAKEAERVAFNAGLLDTTNQASWGIKVIDRAANPDFQNASNTTFFHADKLHLLEAGYQSAAAFEQAALNAIMNEVTVIASRTFGAGHGQTTSTSTSTGAASTTTMTLTNESGAPISVASFAYIGWALQANGTATPGNDQPISNAVIEYPSGTVVGTMTLGGQSNFSVPNNVEWLPTDKVTLSTPIPVGATYVIRSTCTIPNGQKRLHQGGFVGVLTTAMSNVLKKVRIFAIGDSIMTQDARGAVLLAGAGKCPVLQISIGGTKASSYVGAANDKLAKLAKDAGCTHSISNMGTNDLGASQSEVTTAAALIDEKRAFEAQGLSHWWATTLAQQYFAPLAVISAVVDNAAEPVLTVTVSEATAARMEAEMAYTIAGDTSSPTNLNGSWWMTKSGPTTWVAPARTDRAGLIGVGTLTMSPSGGAYSSTVALVPSGIGMATPTPGTSIRASINARGRAGEFGQVVEWADYFETARNSGINVTRQDQPNLYHADNAKYLVASGISSATRFSFSPSTFSNRAQGGSVIFLTGAQRGRAAGASGSGTNDVSIYSGLTAAPAIGDQFVIIAGSGPWANDGVHPSLTANPGGAQTRLIDINKAWIDGLLSANP